MSYCMLLYTLTVLNFSSHFPTVFLSCESKLIVETSNEKQDPID